MTKNNPGPLPRALLRVPLFYKILLANAVLVVLGAAVAVVATTFVIRNSSHPSLFPMLPLFCVVAVLISLAVNGLILRLALHPLDVLERTVERVQKGELHARARVPATADAELEHLILTFNEMLDSLADYRTRVRDIAARALEATERERKRIALELHDETAQTLAALLVQLRIARGITDPEQRNAQLDQVRANMAQALEGVRRFAQGLRPAPLDLLGLAGSIEAHARLLSESTGVRIETDAEPLPRRLAPETELALYRVVQEALSNAVRHAHPRRVRVVLGSADGAVRVRVQDDGAGFDLEHAMSKGGGAGLFGIRERIAYVGGHVDWRTAPGQGTLVEIEVPIVERSGDV